MYPAAIGVSDISIFLVLHHGRHLLHDHSLHFDIPRDVHLDMVVVDDVVVYILLVDHNRLVGHVAERNHHHIRHGADNHVPVVGDDHNHLVGRTVERFLQLRQFQEANELVNQFGV